jgi:BirA family transcriptional regulator, biotin operon repressor / biotin---[acetyl-CoA-carboxylase] ligase
MARAFESITEHTVAQAARDSAIRGAVRYVERTGSTNSDLLAEASRGAAEWTVLVAGEQTAGRGRLGRTWVSKPGQSLMVSALLRPSVEAERAPLLSLAAGVALVDALRSACEVTARCRWPNDLVVRDRKLAGVLSEAVFDGGRLDHVVVGVGINLLQAAEDFPEELRTPATSVALAGGRPDGPGLLRGYLRELATRYGDRGSGLNDSVIDAYRDVSDTLGRTVRAQLSPSESVEGVAVDIGPSGELVIRTVDGGRRIGFGEILHLD